MKNEVVGKKTALQLFAETLKAEEALGQKLLKEGYFTSPDLGLKMGWSRSKTDARIRRLGLKGIRAMDPRNGRQSTFFKPPSK